MCGLVGVMGKIGYWEERAFADLLIVDSVRGLDSTGVAVVNIDQEAMVVKGAVFAQTLLFSKEYKAALAKKPKVLMGHNRAATKGTVSHANAHPFDKGSVIGMHNGTLHSVYNLEDGNSFETDSEAIFHTMHKKGVPHTWNNVDGAATLVWYDRKKRTVDFLRNDKRPLSFALTKDKKSLFWASEMWMLNHVVGRYAAIELDEVFYPEPNYHFSNRISRTGNVIQNHEKLKPFTFISWRLPLGRGIGKPKTWPENENRGKNPYPKRGDFTTKEEFLEAIAEWKTDFEKKWDAGKKDDDKKVIDLRRTTKNIRKRQIRQQNAEKKGVNFSYGTLEAKAFYRKYKNCSFCLETLEGEYGTATILDDRQAICQKCSEDHVDDNILSTIGA